jgi:stearoyl-CoA desaturase (delta-9 desaturase)
VAVIAIPLYAFQHDFSLAAWISMFVLLGVSSLGITAGYHRLWAHRAYEASLPLKIILMIMGTFAVQNSILFWSSGHRTHHRHVDDIEKDPYSINNGFWYAHMGWMLRDEYTLRDLSCYNFICFLLFVPITQLLSYFGIDIALLVQEVDTLI